MLENENSELKLMLETAQVQLHNKSRNRASFSTISRPGLRESIVDVPTKSKSSYAPPPPAPNLSNYKLHKQANMHKGNVWGKDIPEDVINKLYIS